MALFLLLDSCLLSSVPLRPVLTRPAPPQMQKKYMVHELTTRMGRQRLAPFGRVLDLGNV